ncbi:hypothetical protein QTP88_028584 [Uroleucon formosanum]
MWIYNTELRSGSMIHNDCRLTHVNSSNQNVIHSNNFRKRSAPLIFRARKSFYNKLEIVTYHKVKLCCKTRMLHENLIIYARRSLQLVCLNNYSRTQTIDVTSLYTMESELPKRQFRAMCITFYSPPLRSN